MTNVIESGRPGKRKTLRPSDFPGSDFFPEHTGGIINFLEIFYSRSIKKEQPREHASGQFWRGKDHKDPFIELEECCPKRESVCFKCPMYGGFLGDEAGCKGMFDAPIWQSNSYFLSRKVNCYQYNVSFLGKRA